MHLHTQTHTHTYTHMHTQTNTYMHAHTYIHAHIHTYIHTHTYRHIRANIRTDIHIHHTETPARKMTFIHAHTCTLDANVVHGSKGVLLNLHAILLLTKTWLIRRVGQNGISTPYMTVCMVISLLKIPYVHRIYL